jgi:uncharacterized protein
MNEQPDSAHYPQVGRRQFVVIGGAALLAGCTSSRGSAKPPATVAEGTTSASASTSTSGVTTVPVASALPAPSLDTSRQVQGVYIPMRDGTRIAIDVWLPLQLPPTRLPTALQATRYQRANAVDSTKPEDNTSYSLAKRWNDRGYAYVAVDARGSGASFGRRSQELSDDEVRDYGEVIDWIGTQPWSNGRVGAFGVSYSGDTAEHMARNKSKHLAAIAPLFSDFDPYRQLIFPGGAYFAGFDQWLAFTQALDGIDGSIERLARAAGVDVAEARRQFPRAAPVTGADGPKLLAAAIVEHQANATKTLEENPDRDDPRWNDAAVATHRTDIQDSGVPMLVHVGMFDAGTVAGALERYVSFTNPMEVWIGPWSHGGEQALDPTRVAPSSFAGFQPESQFDSLTQFFDRFVRDGERPTAGKQMHLATLGTDGWTDSPEWPIAGTVDRSLFLSGDALVESAPNKSETWAIPTNEHTTGTATRWFTNAGGVPVDYSGWAKGAASRVSFTSASLAVPAKVCGFPVISIDVSGAEDDGLLIAYLEFVDAEGNASYLTEGVLRLSARGKTQPPLRTDQRLDRSFAKFDRGPLTKGTAVSVVLEMMPVSVLFPVGSRIRVSFASSDTDNFRAYSKVGAGLTLHSDAVRSARLVLPIRP